MKITKEMKEWYEAVSVNDTIKDPAIKQLHDYLNEKLKGPKLPSLWRSDIIAAQPNATKRRLMWKQNIIINYLESKPWLKECKNHD